MVGEVTLRERKKIRTRRALVDAATRLFDEKGYAETTVAEIAAAAEVSTKTFFNYFRSKEDVLFADSAQRMNIALRVIAERGPDDTPTQVLLRLIDHTLAAILVDALDVGMSSARLRLQLMNSEPALQAYALRLLLAGQIDLARALARAYPHLDVLTATAIVGAFLGAAQATVVASLARGDDVDTAIAAARDAVDMVLRGLSSLEP